jgi:hypothetical protein
LIFFENSAHKLFFFLFYSSLPFPSTFYSKDPAIGLMIGPGGPINGKTNPKAQMQEL